MQSSAIKKLKYYFIAFVWLSHSWSAAAQNVKLHQGVLTFHSSAPQEEIKAQSKQLQGVLDLAKGTFAMKVKMVSFLGFNSPLQREHFNENYMESDKFPVATYTGKILEEVDLTKDGLYKVRTKGKMMIHGITQERIIPVTIKVHNNEWKVEADFQVLLTDHQITIPRMVNEKLSEQVNVSLQANFKP